MYVPSVTNFFVLEEVCSDFINYSPTYGRAVKNMKLVCVKEMCLLVITLHLISVVSVIVQ
jgi:hypothetical protein